MNTLPIPPRPRTRAVFSPLDRSDPEARRELAPVLDEVIHEDRTDRYFYHKMQRQSRYGR